MEKHFASWWGTILLGETCMCLDQGEKLKFVLGEKLKFVLGENWNVYFHLKVGLRLFSWGICHKPITRCSEWDL